MKELVVQRFNVQQLEKLEPGTYRRSNLGELKAGDAVNLETDISGRYVETPLQHRTS